MNELRLIAPLHSNSGYGKSGRALLAALVSTGWRVQAVEIETRLQIQVGIGGVLGRKQVPASAHMPRPAEQEAELRTALATSVSDDAPTLIMHNPDGLSLFGVEHGGLRIGLTMLEADTLCPHWSRTVANVDVLLAASTWNAETIRPHLPENVPVYVVGLCVDERLWSPDGAAREIKDRPEFLFCSVFSTCERKGWRRLIQAFAEEFRGDDVGLVLKPSNGHEVRQMADWARQLGVWIEVVDGQLTDEEMARLYRACDCYALPSAEGFGVTFIEAALCGLPLVGLAAGATADFVTEAVGVPLAAQMEPCVGQLPFIYRSDYHWPAASVSDIRRGLRQARDEGLRKGIEARRMALSRFSRGAIGRAVGKIVEEEVRASCDAPPFMALGEDELPPVAAIVTTYNHIEQTRRCVQALREHSPAATIVLADDGSTDGTIEWAHGAGILIVQCGHTGNVSANRQTATDVVRQRAMVAPASLPFLVYFDNDVEVTEDWWARLAAVFAGWPEVGILSPRKQLPDGATQNVGNRIVPDGHTGPLMLDRRSIVWCDYVESAAMAVRPEVWTAQRWDPQFRIFYEDTDYCFQARAAGWRIAATAEVSVQHNAHTTSPERAAEAEPNRAAFLRKWKGSL